MNNVLLEDDLKKFRKVYVFALVLGLVLLGVFIFFAIDTAPKVERVVIVFLSVDILLVVGVIIDLIYCTKYKVIVTETTVVVEGIGGSKTMLLKKGLTYNFKAIQAGYYLFTICDGQTTIKLKTQKVKELNEILAAYKE